MTNFWHSLPGVFPDWLATATVSMTGLDDIQIIADILQKSFTIAAIAVGAIWTYFRFFKGRTYRPRLEPEVSGEVVTINGLSHLVAKTHLRNIGASKVEIQQKGSALQVFAYKPPSSTKNIVSAVWEDLAVFPIFESQQWIEPGEEIKEQRLMVMPMSLHTAFQLQLWVTSRSGSWTSRTASWNAMDTITLENSDTQSKGGDGIQAST